MIRFYAPDIENDFRLPEGESAHCCRVLRMRKGDKINVTDGKGNIYDCEILDDNPKSVSLDILKKEKIKEDKSYKLTLAVAPTKNSDRMEWMVEKVVEIGVDSIVLLKCARSERKVMKGDRLVKVMIAAMKQSLAVRLPELVDMEDFNKFVKESDGEAQKFFGYCDSSFPKKEFVKECKPGGEVIMMIGPEGDFTPEEVKLAVENKFMPVTLGNKRLRTETAGVFTVCAVNVLNQLS